MALKQRALAVFIFTGSLLTPLLALAEQGPAGELSFDAALDGVSNVKGGLEQKSAVLGIATLGYNLSFEHGEIGISVLATAGGAPSDYVGDIQSVNNIAADDTATIYDLWYQHRFADDSISVLIGLNDFNAYFSALDNASLYLNSSFGIGPDISQAGPSIYPVTALGIVGQFNWRDQYLLLASYDGVAGDPENPHGTQVSIASDDGLFSAVEWGLSRDDGALKLALGLWHQSAPSEFIATGEPTKRNTGIYLIGQRPLGESIAGFIQIGSADKKRNVISEYLGAGIHRTGLWHAEDTLGIAIAHARASSNLSTDQASASHETALELSYLRPIGSAFSIQPDVQYVVNPSFQADVKNAWVLSVRFGYSWAAQ